MTVLAQLFAQHGPPLVLKSDNGKALTQGGVPALLALHEVTPLLSPIHRPQYNGGCEAGVRAMKARTEDLACLADRSRRWQSEDLAHALQIANEHHRSGAHALSRLAALLAAMELACDQASARGGCLTRNGNRCDPNLAAAECIVRAALWHACAEARFKLQQKCFRKGDPKWPGHQKKISDARAAARNCTTCAAEAQAEENQP